MIPYAYILYKIAIKTFFFNQFICKFNESDPRRHRKITHKKPQETCCKHGTITKDMSTFPWKKPSETFSNAELLSYSEPLQGKVCDRILVPMHSTNRCWIEAGFGMCRMGTDNQTLDPKTTTVSRKSSCPVRAHLITGETRARLSEIVGHTL